MAAVVAEVDVAGKDSGQMFGDPDFLESLVGEANRLLARLAMVGFSVNQVLEDGSQGMVDSRPETLLRLLPREKMEDLADRVHTLKGALL
ncbi:MAG: hypothetical protein HQL67_05245 [Magnetococcales bacterium]|nr:hypothetical protein [Magnetococcales bacterium]